MIRLAVVAAKVTAAVVTLSVAVLVLGFVAFCHALDGNDVDFLSDQGDW